MKGLVQERPNRVRTGLGNGDTDIDFAAIMAGADPEEILGSDGDGRNSRMSDAVDDIDVKKAKVDSDAESESDDERAAAATQKRGAETMASDSEEEKGWHVALV